PACGAVGNNPGEASMRKQLLALLSMLGLAGWAAPTQAQAIKGKEDDKAQAESTMKSSKANTESNAQKVVSGHKGQVASAEGGHATSDVVNEKLRKAGAEQNATGLKHKHKQTASEKTAVSQELTHKDKWSKTQSENAAASAQIKGEKSAAEVKAQGSEASIKKQQNVAAGAAAAQNDANKKANQASPK